MDHTFFIIGGGPSVNTTPIHLLENFRCIGVNNSYTVAPWVEFIWFGDTKWWDWHKSVITKLPNQIATCCHNPRVHQEAKQAGKDLLIYKRDGKGRGISERQDNVCWNGNSGASAINLAYHMGAKRIILIGFDMRRINGEKNFHNDHKEASHNPFRRHLKGFPLIAKDAKRFGIEILNATPGSAISDFPIISLKDVINDR